MTPPFLLMLKVGLALAVSVLRPYRAPIAQSKYQQALVAIPLLAVEGAVLVEVYAALGARDTLHVYRRVLGP
jgi:hypothetical protein